MNTLFVYPGTFSPPTKGHLFIAQEAARIFPQVIILCSTNKDKEPWFSPDWCKELWKSYDLPNNVRIMTLDELMEAQKEKKKEIVMIRGIRNANDLLHEQAVMELNERDFGITKYFYINANPALSHISSSLAREYATDLRLEQLAELVSPMCVTALLEYVLKIKNLILVVGRVASGKSTILKQLVEVDGENVHINTDTYNHKLRPLLEKRYGKDADLTAIAQEEDAEIRDILAPMWFGMLAESLKNARGKRNVFVEIPYGLQPDKQMFRFVGGKVLCVHCSPETSQKRLEAKGKTKLAGFIHKVPDLYESRKIARQNKLILFNVSTEGTIANNMNEAIFINSVLSTNSFHYLAIFENML